MASISFMRFYREALVTGPGDVCCGERLTCDRMVSSSESSRLWNPVISEAVQCVSVCVCVCLRVCVTSIFLLLRLWVLATWLTTWQGIYAGSIPGQWRVPQKKPNTDSWNSWRGYGWVVGMNQQHYHSPLDILRLLCSKASQNTHYDYEIQFYA